MNRKFLLFSRILTGAFALVSGVLWLNNLVSAGKFHFLLLSGFPGAAEKVTGFLPFLQWSAVDVSTVTTFVPFFGFLLFFAALFPLRRREEWPFFPGYERLNVALGLLGTIWGIILIGFYPSSDISIASLMKCLHTAMFSTLAAVGWVMVLMPLILTPWSRKLLPESAEAEENSPEWEELLETLHFRLQKSGEAVSEMNGRLSSFADALKAVQQAMETLAAATSEREKEESRFRQEAAAVISALSPVVEKWTAREEALCAENRLLAGEKEKLGAALDDSRRTICELQGKLNALKELLQ